MIRFVFPATAESHPLQLQIKRGKPHSKWSNGPIHEANWRFLTNLGSSKGGPDDKVGKVEFSAEYFEADHRHELHERSRFKRYIGAWKYLDGRG